MLNSLGPKTVHFWAPMFKWGLVIAGLADINRPVEKVSIFQSAGKPKKNELRILIYVFYVFYYNILKLIYTSIPSSYNLFNLIKLWLQPV